MTRKSEEEMVDQFLNYDGEESGATGVESSAANNNADKNTNLATADKADQKVGAEKDQNEKQPENTSEQEPANGFGEDDCTWEAESNVYADDLVEEYWSKKKEEETASTSKSKGRKRAAQPSSPVMKQDSKRQRSSKKTKSPRTKMEEDEFDEDWENQVVAVETVTRDDKTGELLEKWGNIQASSERCQRKMSPEESSSTATEHTCPVCNIKCAAVELSDQLPPNLNMFFRPAHEIMDEAADVLRQTNTFSLLRFLKDEVTKQKQMLDKAKDELLQYKDIKNQLQAIKKENQRLKAQIQDVRSSIAINETTESPSKLNSSLRTRKLSGDRHSNHSNHVSPNQPRTPNPPTRLSLPDSSSPVHSYYNHNGNGFTPDNQPLWNKSEGFDDGVMSNKINHDKGFIGQSSNKTYSAFINDGYEKYSQQSRLQSFPRPGTASGTRMTWNQLHNDAGYLTRPSTPIMNGYGTHTRSMTPTNFQASRISARPFLLPSHSDGSSFMAPQTLPRTPVMRNRSALPGLNNQIW
ncbi:12532_t:CDS:10 [Cetraspora pellucida]|uniref:12532_t:CDS:1 n=1 Tax=Cetraspora pellucida TaxID=1433469 RepID=A0A9N9FYX6_9GLOM|nr:12532_t:CDS:10 [Cetraspora pellucida]